MVTAAFDFWFCLDFSHEITKQTNRSRVCTRVTVGKELCRLFGRQKQNIGRHRSYRHVLNLRLRCRRKTKNRLPSKHCRRIALPPKTYRHIWCYRLRRSRYRQKMSKPLTAKILPRYCITAEKITPYFGVTASTKVVTANKTVSFGRFFFFFFFFQVLCS